jgi:hypothetical protein
MSTRKPPPFAISAQSDDNIESVVVKIERVRLTLRAKADYTANLSAERVQPDLFIAINAHRHRPTEWPMLATAPN